MKRALLLSSIVVFVAFIACKSSPKSNSQKFIGTWGTSMPSSWGDPWTLHLYIDRDSTNFIIHSEIWQTNSYDKNYGSYDSQKDKIILKDGQEIQFNSQSKILRFQNRDYIQLSKEGYK